MVDEIYIGDDDTLKANTKFIGVHNIKSGKLEQPMEYYCTAQMREVVYETRRGPQPAKFIDRELFLIGLN